MKLLNNRNYYVHIENKKGKRYWSEPKIILASFLAILLPSALLLTLPLFSVSGLSFIDALFTATSAISVTGLGVVDTSVHFTIEGKILLMLLMEVGGLGQMTLSAVLLYMFGLRLSLVQRNATREALGQSGSSNIQQLVKDIIVFAVVAQLMGLVLLACRWVPDMGWQQGLFYALFHAISAFNNAGFSLFSNSMVDFVGDPLVIFTLTTLLVFGGLGFTVISDIKRNGRKGFKSLSLHSKIMLMGTFVLLLIGMLLFWLLERNNTLSELPIATQWLASFFQSASARTAGFNSIDISQFSQPALLVMMMLMLIGAGSTSTGGGIKVSTFVVALGATWAFLRQQSHVVLFKRSVAWTMVTKSLAIIVVSFLVLVIAMFLLMITENATFSLVVFETISAFATVGLSAGLTAELSETGKLIMVVVMVIGRIGPLTLAYMLATSKPTLLKYPEGTLLAG
jgi:trk system potassium uptake protein TrkH